MPILANHELVSGTWANLQKHWAAAIKDELRGGKTELLGSYDDAYVAQLEADRGTITVAEYARLVVAAERGLEQQTLAELALPAAAVPRLRRVWLRRTLADRDLARRIRRAIDEA